MMPSVDYVVLPILGADGAGKTSLARLLASAAGATAHEVRVEGRAATVIDVERGGRVHQLVDFLDATTERALLPSSRARGAILVVSALDSVLPSTRDSAIQARECGIPIAAVALTQCDLIEDVEMLDLVTMEIRELLTKCASNSEIAIVPTAMTGHPREGKNDDPVTGPRRLLGMLLR